MEDAPSPITTDELVELLKQTGHHHHQAYMASNGVDPEWALFYAGYLQSHLWDRAGVLPTRSRLVQLLLNAEAAFNATGSTDPWQPSYAKFILNELQASN